MKKTQRIEESWVAYALKDDAPDRKCVKVEGDENLSDMMTKPLELQKLQKFMRRADFLTKA